MLTNLRCRFFFLNKQDQAPFLAIKKAQFAAEMIVARKCIWSVLRRLDSYDKLTMSFFDFVLIGCIYLSRSMSNFLRSFVLRAFSAVDRRGLLLRLSTKVVSLNFTSFLGKS